MTGRLWLVLAALAAALLTAGCGKARFDFKIDVLSPTEMSLQATAKGEGVFAEVVRETFDPLETSGPGGEGWEVQTESFVDEYEDEIYVIKASKPLGPGVQPLGLGDTDGPEATLSLEVTQEARATLYRVRIVVPPQGASTGPGAPSLGEEMEDPIADLGPEFAQAMASLVKMRWTVNLPGEVVETNADRRTQNGGSWIFDLDRLQKGGELVIVSRAQRE